MHWIEHTGDHIHHWSYRPIVQRVVQAGGAAVTLLDRHIVWGANNVAKEMHMSHQDQQHLFRTGPKLVAFLADGRVMHRWIQVVCHVSMFVAHAERTPPRICCLD